MKMMTLSLVLLAGCGPGDDGDMGAADLSVVTDMATPPDMTMPQPDMAVETDDPLLAVITRDTMRAAVGAYTGTNGGAQPTYDFTAQFITQDTFSLNATSVGSCKLFHVVTNDAGFASAPTSSTGAVHLTGGTQALSINDVDGGASDKVMGNGLLWTGGTLLTVSGSGGSPGTWSTSLIGPGAINITAPTRPSGQGNVAIAKNQPLDLAWGGATGGWITVTFTDNAGSNPDVGICTALATDGHLTIPASTLAQMPNRIDITTSSERLVNANGWLIEVFATSDGLDNQGTPFYGVVN